MSDETCWKCCEPITSVDGYWCDETVARHPNVDPSAAALCGDGGVHEPEPS